MAPTFCLPDKDGEMTCLADRRGMHTIIYFYPKDGSKGCTQQAKDFSAAKKKFEQMGVEVIGISPDSQSSHDKFVKKNDITVKLLSDEASEVCEAYGVWQKKSMYGKEFMGVVRTTYVIGPDCRIEEAWHKVKVPGHVDEVLAVVSGLLA